MKSQNLPIGISFVDTYKNVVDRFGGPVGIAEMFGWNPSTIYRWLGGNVMSLSYAMCISAKDSRFTIKDLTGDELKCKEVYVDLIGFFGGQTAVAEALGVSQYTVHAWTRGKANISLNKAVLLETISHGRFHPSDFITDN